MYKIAHNFVFGRILKSVHDFSVHKRSLGTAPVYGLNRTCEFNKKCGFISHFHCL